MTSSTDISDDRAVALVSYRPAWQHHLPFPVRTMARRWRGMIAMVAGVGLALSLAMTMMALSKALMEMFTADFLASNVSVYAITSGGTLIGMLPGETPGTIKHGHQRLAQIRGLAPVRTAIGTMTWTMERQREGVRRDPDAPAEMATVVGVAGDPTTIPNLALMVEGRWPRRGDEIVVGRRYSREKAVLIGDSLRLNDRDFRIVGIGRLRGVAGISSNTLIYMDDEAFRERTGIGDVLSVISIDTDQPAEVRQRLDEMGDLRSYTPQELVTLAEQANATSVFTYQLLGGLTLAIGALFVSNMLAQSVIERRLEFAMLKAIGLPNRTVLLIVALEAVLICLTASVVGILLSLVMGQAMNRYYDSLFGFESLYAPDAGIFTNVFVLAMGLGLLAGLLPARRATRVDPIDILREA